MDQTSRFKVGDHVHMVYNPHHTGIIVGEYTSTPEWTAAGYQVFVVRVWNPDRGNVSVQTLTSVDLEQGWPWLDERQ